MNTLEFINQLQSYDKNFFTIFDLEKITGQDKNSLKVKLSRLVKQKILIRLQRGVYQLAQEFPDIRQTANQLYYPSYLSFESTLSDYGILSQIPYTQTFATNKKSKKLTLANTEIEYTQLKTDLFWGYILKNNIYIAQPEKALLDELYLISKGKRKLDFKQLDLSSLDKDKLKEYSQKYPEYTQKLFKTLNF